MKCLSAVLLFAGLSGCIGWQGIRAEDGRGTLVLRLQPFTSEVKLKSKVEAQLKSGGVEWGVDDGQVVVSLLNKRFVDFDIDHFTRFGAEDTVDVKAGDYRVTCIGFVPEGGFSVEKALAKGAYLNLDVVTFSVAPGETVVLEIAPVIQKKSSFFVKYFIPSLLLSITANGTTGPTIEVNERTEASVAWGDYDGPLKF